MPLSPKSFVYACTSDTQVATITLNRPDRLNALTFEVYQELTDTFRALARGADHGADVERVERVDVHIRRARRDRVVEPPLHLDEAVSVVDGR